MKPRLLQLLVFVLLVGTWHLAEAVEPLKSYDTFEVGPISPDRWLGTSFGTGAAFLDSSNLYEGHRAIIGDPSGPGRVLRIFSRFYGSTDSNEGATYGEYGLAFKNSDTVTAIRARFQVLNVQSKGCSLSAVSTDSGAEILGWFFNTGNTPPTDPQDGTNDVLVGLQVVRGSVSSDPAGVLNIRGFVFQCQDHDCFAGSNIGNVSLGQVTEGQWVRLLLQWDKDNKQFKFQRDSQASQVVSYDGVLTETGPAHFPVKRIAVRSFVANCTGPARPVGTVNALFDNVFVNQNAQP